MPVTKSIWRRIYDYLGGIWSWFINGVEKLFGLKAMHTPNFEAFLHEVMKEKNSVSNGLNEREVILQTALS